MILDHFPNRLPYHSSCKSILNFFDVSFNLDHAEIIDNYFNKSVIVHIKINGFRRFYF